jgi:hypothetical protein
MQKYIEHVPKLSVSEITGESDNDVNESDDDIGECFVTVSSVVLSFTVCTSRLRLFFFSVRYPCLMLHVPE